MPPQTFGHYRIVDELGTGGMGTVYRAVDTDLGRTVAVKFLRPEFAAQAERRERFLKEARAAAAITHPNVCTIYDVGRIGDELFIVMQLIQGRTLAAALRSGRLEWQSVLKISLQLADALTTAHENGVVHGDLKPSNIMLRPSDDITVLDFGLAAILIDQPYDAEGSTTSGMALARPGMAVGTVGYMAPEQIRGDALSARSDVFAFGVTIYEAATGHSPFVRPDLLQSLAATLDDDPAPVRSTIAAFPPYLDDCLLKCLSKVPDQRYASGRELAEALRRSTARSMGPPRPRATYRSLAVLPLGSHEGAPEDSYIGEAVAGELVTKLARLKQVVVTSRSATLQYQDSTLSMREIGRELGVEAILEVALSKQGPQCRIAVRMFEVDTGFCVWADSYDGSVDELLQMQDKVANRVARAVKARFLRGDAAEPRDDDVNAEAYRLYLKARALYYRFNDTDNLLAIEGFRRAVALDPRYARAHAGFASACLARLERGWESDDARWTAEALDACDRALALNKWVSEAYSARGSVRIRQLRPLEAEADFRRALAVNPNDETAHGMLGLVLFERGDLEAAARCYRRALKIRPGYVWCWNDLAWVMWLTGRESDTEQALAKVLNINPMDEVARVGVATGLYFRGELAQAEEVARTSIEINPHHPFSRPVLAVAIARRGRISEAESICAAVLRERPREFLTSAALAVVYAIAGDEEKLRQANDAALTIPAGRVPLNANVAIHFAFLNREEYVRPWLRKALKEGMAIGTLLKRNPLLRSYEMESSSTR